MAIEPEQGADDSLATTPALTETTGPLSGRENETSGLSQAPPGALSFYAVGVEYGFERDASTIKPTAKIVFGFRPKGIVRRPEDIVGMTVDLEITGGDTGDVIIDTINPDSAHTVTIGPYTVQHSVEDGLEPSMIPTHAGPVSLRTIKYTTQRATIQGKDVDFTIDRERRRARIQLRNLRGARIPRDYRILLKLVKIGGQGQAGWSTGVSREFDRASAAFPFTIHVLAAKVVSWSDSVPRSLRTWSIERAPATPSQSFTFSRGLNEADVLAHSERELGLVEAFNELEQYLQPSRLLAEPSVWCEVGVAIVGEATFDEVVLSSLGPSRHSGVPAVILDIPLRADRRDESRLVVDSNSTEKPQPPPQIASSGVGRAAKKQNDEPHTAGAGAGEQTLESGTSLEASREGMSKLGTPSPGGEWVRSSRILVNPSHHSDKLVMTSDTPTPEPPPVMRVPVGAVQYVKRTDGNAPHIARVVLRFDLNGLREQATEIRYFKVKFVISGEGVVLDSAFPDEVEQEQVNGKDVEFFIDVHKPSNSATVYLDNPNAARIPKNYRVLVTIKRGFTRPTSLADNFPFKLTVAKNSMAVICRTQTFFAVEGYSLVLSKGENEDQIYGYRGFGLKGAMADDAAFKAEADKSFAAKDYLKATELYSQAIKLEPSNHVLYSNRSASKAGLKDYVGALEDAEKTIELDPSFSKGHARKGAALLGLRRYPDAAMAYEAGLKVDTDSDLYMKGLADVRKAMDADPDNPASPALHEDKDIVLEAVKRDRRALRFFPSTALQADRNFMKAIKRDRGALRFASPALQADKNVVIKAVKQYGPALEYAAPALKRDKDIVLEAVKQDGSALKYASPALQGDKDFVLEAVKHHGSALKYASPALLRDKDIVLEAVKQEGLKALKYASPALLSDKDIVFEAVKQDGSALKYASPALQGDKDFVLEAVKQHGWALEYASPALRGNKDVVLEAVKRNGSALRFASPALQADKNVVIEAVKQYDSADQYATPALRVDPLVVVEAATRGSVHEGIKDDLKRALIRFQQDRSSVLIITPPAAVGVCGPSTTIATGPSGSAITSSLYSPQTAIRFLHNDSSHFQSIIAQDGATITCALEKPVDYLGRPLVNFPGRCYEVFRMEAKEVTASLIRHATSLAEASRLVVVVVRSKGSDVRDESGQPSTEEESTKETGLGQQPSQPASRPSAGVPLSDTSDCPLADVNDLIRLQVTNGNISPAFEERISFKSKFQHSENDVKNGSTVEVTIIPDTTNLYQSSAHRMITTLRSELKFEPEKNRQRDVQVSDIYFRQFEVNDAARLVFYTDTIRSPVSVQTSRTQSTTYTGGGGLTLGLSPAGNLTASRARMTGTGANETTTTSFRVAPVSNDTFHFTAQPDPNGVTPPNWYLAHSFTIKAEFDFVRTDEPRVKTGYQVNLNYKVDAQPERPPVRVQSIIVNTILTPPLRPGMLPDNRATTSSTRAAASPSHQVSVSDTRGCFCVEVAANPSHTNSTRMGYYIHRSAAPWYTAYSADDLAQRDWLLQGPVEENLEPNRLGTGERLRQLFRRVFP